jgi:hypothetical protein
MPLPDMLLIDGVEYRRADRDEPEAKDPTAGHSPLPWISFHRHIGSADGLFVCECPGHDSIGQRVWDANRSFIIRATAHHADLVAFVEKVIRYSIEMDNSGINWPRIVLDAHELIAKVKGT